MQTEVWLNDAIYFKLLSSILDINATETSFLPVEVCCCRCVFVGVCEWA